jgi:hypothetical protein
MNVTIEYNNALYSFSRDLYGVGGWVCVKGRCQGMIGFLTSQVYVHAELNTELTKAAVAAGLGSSKDFSKTIKQEKAEPIRRITRAKRRKRTGGVIGGISLASLFDTGHDELAEEEVPSEVTYEEI